MNPTLQRLRDVSCLLNLLIYSCNRGSLALRHAWHPQGEENVGPHPAVTGTVPVVGDQPPFGDRTPEVIVAKHFLGELQTACRQRGAGFVVVYIPRQEEFGELVEYKGPPFSTREHATLLRCVASLGIEVIDLLPRFLALKSESPERRLTFCEGHWNAAGHRVACDSLCEYLSAFAR